MPSITIREATPGDAATVVALIRELAAYENLEDQVRITEADVVRDGFGGHRYFECLIAEVDGAPVGFALYFHNYSTFEGRSGIYVEDVYVRESARGLGLGRKLMARLGTIAHARGCRRLELWVLHWNPARDFYHRLGFRHMGDWLPYRLDGDDLARLASQDR